MTVDEAKDRLYVCYLAGGTSYADRKIEKRGDYKRLAFVPRGSDTLEWGSGRLDPALRKLIQEHYEATR